MMELQLTTSSLESVESNILPNHSSANGKFFARAHTETIVRYVTLSGVKFTSTSLWNHFNAEEISSILAHAARIALKDSAEGWCPWRIICNKAFSALLRSDTFAYAWSRALATRMSTWNPCASARFNHALTLKGSPCPAQARSTVQKRKLRSKGGRNRPSTSANLGTLREPSNERRARIGWGTTCFMWSYVNRLSQVLLLSSSRVLRYNGFSKPYVQLNQRKYDDTTWYNQAHVR